MKICRFNHGRLGIVEGSTVLDVTDALAVIPSVTYPYPRHDPLIAHLPALMARMRELAPNAPRLPLADIQVQLPLANPGKIIAAPVNYTNHLKEVLDDPNLHHNNQINHIERAGLFLKAQSSLADPCDGVHLTMPERRTDHEVELVIVIGKTARNVERDQALSYVAGYCIGLDITIRGPEERSFRKSPDTYTLMGPWLTTPDDIPDVSALDLALNVDDEVRQSSNTSQLILGVPELIAFASRFYTLHPGDVIFTGTPEGVGPIKAGQQIHARIEGLGELKVDVHA